MVPYPSPLIPSRGQPILCETFCRESWRAACFTGAGDSNTLRFQPGRRHGWPYSAAQFWACESRCRSEGDPHCISLDLVGWLIEPRSGRTDGRSDGQSDGRSVGQWVGWTLGRTDSRSDRQLVGRTFSRTDSRSDRQSVGRRVVRTDGGMDGRSDGRSDGHTVGRAVGWMDGVTGCTHIG